ncbi:MAG: hypothetical protein EXR69_07475 [Myxococcales bacterium]|nr:hypothetical protein [Myxococcales bacterium]
MPTAREPAPHNLDRVEAVPRPEVRAVLEADHACYPPAYRVSLVKVQALCDGFPEGVTLYRGRFGGGRLGGTWHPLGYSAWHPFDPDLLERPWPTSVAILPGAPSAYLYNYSVIPAFIGSPIARELMTRLAEQIRGIPTLAADTVSIHGVRAAQRWGMRLHEARQVDGAPWELWARRGGAGPRDADPPISGPRVNRPPLT